MLRPDAAGVVARLKWKAPWLVPRFSAQYAAEILRHAKAKLMITKVCAATLLGALALLLCLGGDAGAAPLTPAGPETATQVELVRRCPPGYRRTIGGCVKKRPSWWSLLLGS